MAKICCKVKGNAEPMDRPRVYFTCHPEDQSQYFERILGDLFAAHDCAVYYTDNMEEQIPEDDREFDLGRNHLFVVPVTSRLLRTPNRAMDEDIPYAIGKHIPVLPILMEPGLDALYALPGKFGALQYLDCSVSDPTRIAYPEKLKKYLDEVLHSRTDLEAIRSAFSARIFLSYRKGDRKHANELLRIVHSHEQLRDVAVWFDEFLPLGENFRESIDRTLAQSVVFLLVVTPKLLEPGNFVMEVEYPAAVRAGIPIIPVEAEPTELEALENLPECLDAHDHETVWARILEALPAREDMTEYEKLKHDYLIGCAYLEGIDVETDCDRGMELVTSAAMQCYPDAMDRVYRMYSSGRGVKVDYRRALEWAAKRSLVYMGIYPQGHPRCLRAMGEMASMHSDLGEWKLARAVYEDVYKMQCAACGEKHEDTIDTLFNLAHQTYRLGAYQEALSLFRKVYDLQCEVRGREHEKTLRNLEAIAIVYSGMGDYHKALPIQEEVYKQELKVLGEEDSRTFYAMTNLAAMHYELRHYQEALEIAEQAYHGLCRVYGEDSHKTLLVLNNLGKYYDENGNREKALDIYIKVYRKNCELYGKDHPNTLVILNNMAAVHQNMGDHQQAYDLLKEAYDGYSGRLGEDHPQTLTIYNNMRKAYRTLVRNPSNNEKLVQNYSCRELLQQAEAYRDVGRPEKELEARLKLYELLCKDPGEAHSKTLDALHTLAAAHREYENHEKALELVEKEYAIRLRVQGADHTDTEKAGKMVKSLRRKLGLNRPDVQKKGFLSAIGSFLRKPGRNQN